MTNPKQEILDSTESSDSSGSTSGSRGRNDSLLLRNGRYRRVPTSEEQLQLDQHNREDLERRGHRGELNQEGNEHEREDEALDLEKNNR